MRASPPSQRMWLQQHHGHPPWERLPVSHLYHSQDESSSEPCNRQLFVIFFSAWTWEILSSSSTLPRGEGIPWGYLWQTPRPLGLKQYNKHHQAAKPSKSNPTRRDVLREAPSLPWHPRRPGGVSSGCLHSSATVEGCSWRVAKGRDSSHQPRCPNPLSPELAECPDRLAGC